MATRKSTAAKKPAAKKPAAKKPAAKKPAAKKPAAKKPSSDRDEKGLFAKGNKIWQMWDGKNGNPRIFKNPQELWDKAVEYFEYCDNNPIEVIDFRGKDADEVVLKKMRAYTWQGLEVFLGVFKLRKYKTEYAEFEPVVTRIGQIMYAQKFEGAAAGVLNANIIARDLGLREQTHVSVDDDRKKVADLFPDELDGENATEEK